MTSRIRWLLLLSWSLVISFTTAQAQIFISPDDFPNVTGMTLTYYTNITTSVLVNVGQSGANQTWDFREGPEEQQTQEQIIQTSTSPFYDQFPTANRTRLSDTNPFGFPGESYTYREMSNQELRLLGFGSLMNGMSIPIHLGATGIQEYPMPLTYHDGWQSTVGIDTTFRIANPDTTIPLDSLDIRVVAELGDQDTVDAWGTLDGPLGSHQVLRVRHDTGVTATVYVWLIFFWSPIWDTSYVEIRYEWLAQQYGPIVSISSQPGETNPEFTDASRVVRLMDISTDIPFPPQAAVPLAISLSPNYPNPFNESTTLTFSLPGNIAGKASLKVYNLLGQRVLTLWEGTADGRVHQVIWNGRDARSTPVASGMYFIQLRAGPTMYTRPVVKLN